MLAKGICSHDISIARLAGRTSRPGRTVRALTTEDAEITETLL
jgi:hypothetical protein